jgi:hypothetical protein
VISSMPRGEDGEITREEGLKRATRRKVLRIKLLIYFGLGLFVNAANLITYTLGRYIFTRYFGELSLVSVCGLAGYLILNLYFLDVLRDGVLDPPKSRERV